MITRRRLGWILATALGTPIVLYGLGWAYVVVAPVADDRRHRLVFDAEAWRGRSADAGPEWPTRLRMVDSLVDRRLLDGLTRQQVQRLLDGSTRTASPWGMTPVRPFGAQSRARRFVRHAAQRR